METLDVMKKMIGCDAIYLDTTYCDPSHTFPSQQTVIEEVKKAVKAELYGVSTLHKYCMPSTIVHSSSQQTVKKHLSPSADVEKGIGKNKSQVRGTESSRASDKSIEEGTDMKSEEPKVQPQNLAVSECPSHTPITSSVPFRPRNVVFLCGAYTIGKERVYLSVARAFNLRIYANPRRIKILEQLNLPDADLMRLTSDPKEAALHVVDMWRCSFKFVEQNRKFYQNFTSVIIIRPSGWEYQPGSTRKSSSPSVAVAAAAAVPAQSTSTSSTLPFFQTRGEGTSKAVAQPISAIPIAPTSSERGLGDGKDTADVEELEGRSGAANKGGRSRKEEGAGAKTRSKAAKQPAKVQPPRILRRQARKKAVMYSAPYSEHSSFDELRRCVAFLKPKWIIPTVNNSSREKVEAMRRMLLSTV
uniref:DNA repair metallo-beta-lactamase domain-containing protein n=1 Tax=Palpitomonas bilix TaxID=652834 RepID=A0A7S3DH35_9EUKA|mmetsp:Transcript_37578/g.96970  ORF Transcript_37578/g.96970 Transcript_37578/m.96970 type:complete len:415 (+) Transcript_37578:1169-2413(+)